MPGTCYERKAPLAFLPSQAESSQDPILYHQLTQFAGTYNGPIPHQLVIMSECTPLRLLLRKAYKLLGDQSQKALTCQMDRH
jgi:hypothetical protein